MNADGEGTDRMERLYADVFACTTCIGAKGCQIKHDPERIRRKAIDKALDSKVFLVGQALSRRTQRKSGLPYVLPDGRLSQAGRKLDAFLSAFGYTIDPSSQRQYAYCSDLVQHYPGKVGRGDRRPTSTERNNCSVWLRKELELIRPRVVILLGEIASRDFLSRYGTKQIRLSTIPWGRRFECQIPGLRFVAFVLPHFSYRFRTAFAEAVRRETAQHIRSSLHVMLPVDPRK